MVDKEIIINGIELDQTGRAPTILINPMTVAIMMLGFQS